MLFRGDDAAGLLRRRREALVVGALLLVGLALRVYQVDWDQGHLYHPDERFILMSTAAISLSWPPNLAQLLTPQSTLIPPNFSYSYGTFSFYLLRLVAAILSWLGGLVPSFHWFDDLGDLGNLRLIGRPISALFDTATIYLIYRLGRLLYGRRVALLAAALVTFSVLDVQLSHFYATDTIMTALVVGAIVFSVAYLRDGRAPTAMIAGAFVGFALATKASAAPVLVPVLAAHALRLSVVAAGDRGLRLRWPDAEALARGVEHVLATLAVAAAAFLLAEPYAVIDVKRYVTGISEQGAMVRGIADLPYTRQYFGRPAYLYFLQNLVLFGVGVPLGLAMLAGWVYVVVRNVWRPRPGELVVLSYVIPYFAITGDFWAKFLRYMLPISPLLALFAAVALVHLLNLVRGWRLGAHPAEAPEVKPTLVRLPPELVPEELADDFDTTSLLALEGTAESDELALASGVLEAEPSREADWPRPGASDRAGHESEVVEVAGEAPSSVARPAADEPARIDPAARRFAMLKGLSEEWFVEAPVEASSADAGGVGANGYPRRNGASADGWVEVEPDDEEPDLDVVTPRPLPAWLGRRSGVAAFLATRWPMRIVGGVIGVVVAFSACYTLAYDHMYASPTPPVVASQWLYQNAPRGAVLATEHWEEGMPVPIETTSGVETAESHGFRNVTMPLYEDDTPAKLNTIVNNLVAADYVVFFSNRLYGTIPRIPARYPMSRRYYEKLFGEQLGFTLVYVSARYPNLLGVAFVDDTLDDPGLPTPALLRRQSPAPLTINLGHADESFSVYDHQKVLIFKKTQRLTPDELRALIGPPPAPNQVFPTGQQPQYKSLRFTPTQEALVQTGGTFSELFDRTDVFNQLPLPTWVLLSLLVGLAGSPFAFLVFRFLPDRGHLLGKPLGILGLAWLGWMLVSLGVTEATRPAALAIFGVFLGVSALAAVWQRDAILGFVRANWRLLAIEEGLFWVAFFSDVWIRSLNPDLWHPTLGGEKPMDLAYFTAATRSPIYPPYDPWFAGGYMNYYYFGQIIVGTLTKISGIVPTTAYNLIVPLWFALTVGGTFSVALALIARGRTTPQLPAVAGGVLAALMVCVLGNIGGFGQLIGDLAQQSTVTVPSAIPGVGPLIAALSGLLNVVVGARPLVIPPDWYWSSTRMLALLGIQGGTGSINEFPYFTFLFADLHAHLIGLPYTLLVLGLCVNVVKSEGRLAHLLGRSSDPDGGLAGAERPRLATASTVAAVLVAGLAAGALYPINSWDYPTYVGLLGLSLALPWYRSARPDWRGLLAVAGQFAAIVLLSQLLYRPFYASFQSFYGGVHLIDEKSEIRWYVAINGLFLVVMISYFLLEGWATYRRSGLVRALRLYVGRWELLPRTLQLRRQFGRASPKGSALALYGLATLALVVALTVALGMSLTGALLVLLVAALALGLRRDGAPEDRLMVLLFATGLAISIGTDQVAIDGDVGRMNTIFKFYEQVWVLYGVASAVALIRLKDRLLYLSNGLVRHTWIGVLVVFFLMASVYPILGTKARVSQRFDPTIPPTLDGMAYMDHAIYVDTDEQTRRTAQLHFVTDKEAILWLQQNVVGTPTILEGTRPLYRWGARFSIYTGLPTVIGWDWHQKQQRWGYQNLIDEREAAVQRLYDDPSPETTLSLLRLYDVKYVIDGELEQGFYPRARAKFDSMVGTSLRIVYDRDGVRIYEVE